MEIQGNIIRIVDKTTVIINLGKKDGIKGDSIFRILGNPEQIIDPFTKENLGLVTIVKAKVKAAQIYEKFTIATTRWSSIRLKLQATLGTQISSLFDTEDVDEGELLVNSSDLQPWKAKSEIPVKVGDIVMVEITGLPAVSEQEGKKSNEVITEQSEKENDTTEVPQEK